MRDTSGYFHFLKPISRVQCDNFFNPLFSDFAVGDRVLLFTDKGDKVVVKVDMFGKSVYTPNGVNLTQSEASLGDPTVTKGHRYTFDKKVLADALGIDVDTINSVLA